MIQRIFFAARTGRQRERKAGCTPQTCRQIIHAHRVRIAFFTTFPCRATVPEAHASENDIIFDSQSDVNAPQHVVTGDQRYSGTSGLMSTTLLRRLVLKREEVSAVDLRIIRGRAKPQ